MFLYFLIPCAIICIVFFIYKSISDKKTIYNKLLMLSQKYNYSLNKSSGKLHNYILENENTIIYLKCISIPKNSSITVNSKSTWCLRYGGGTRSGRAYPNKEYLTELADFLTKDYNESKKIRKVVLVYPSTEKLLKYINESEIITLKQSDLVYGTQVIMFSCLDEFLFESTPHHHCL